MKARLCAAVFLCAISGSAVAEWLPVSEHEDSELYVDPDSLREGTGPDSYTMWILVNYKSPREAGLRKKLLSGKCQTEVQCKNEVIRGIYGFAYPKAMGKGTVIKSFSGPNACQPIAPETFNQAIFSMVCD